MVLGTLPHKEKVGDDMSIAEQILIFIWKTAWAWIPFFGLLTAAGIYETKKGIK